MHRPSGPPSGGLAPETPKRERNAALTQERLLDSAENEFAARGFAGARLREIAEGAGVQPALIHHYFGDKQGLYRAVLDRALLPTSTESWGLLADRQDLEGLVRGFVDVLVRFYATHQNLLAILRHDSSSGSELLVGVCRERSVPIIDAVVALLQQKQREGEVRADLEAREIVVAAMSMVAYPFAEAPFVEGILPGAVPSDEGALERRKKTVTTMLLAGMRPG